MSNMRLLFNEKPVRVVVDVVELKKRRVKMRNILRAPKVNPQVIRFLKRRDLARGSITVSVDWPA